MNALRYHKPGFKIDTLPIETPTSNDLLVKVRAAAITRGELEWPESVGRSTPIPAYDVAGTVGELGSSATKFKKGDEVIGLISFLREGAAAEYTLANEDELALRPAGLRVEDAAAMGLSTLTVWQALFIHAGMKAGQKLLVTGAGGGVGVVLVQIAAWAGVRVSGTCSGSKKDFVQSLGAEEIFDYNVTSIDELPTDFDAVIDCVGDKTLLKCFHRLRQGGKLISLVRPLDENETAQRPDVDAKFFIVEPSGDQLQQIVRLWEQGLVRPVVQSVLPLEEGAKAFEMLADGHTKGKIVLKIRD